MSRRPPEVNQISKAVQPPHYLSHHFRLFTHHLLLCAQKPIDISYLATLGIHYLLDVSYPVISLAYLLFEHLVVKLTWSASFRRLLSLKLFFFRLESIDGLYQFLSKQKLVLLRRVNSAIINLQALKLQLLFIEVAVQLHLHFLATIRSKTALNKFIKALLGAVKIYIGHLDLLWHLYLDSSFL